MTTSGYRVVLAQLHQVQKSGRGAPAYSRWVNRRAGRYLAAWAHQCGLSPNQVTAISAAVTFSAITVIAVVRPAWWVGLLVSGGLLVGYAFDSADGQLARLTGRGSAAGEWLDHVVDCVKSVSLHLAVVISWWRFDSLRHPALLLIPLGYCVVAVTFFFATILSEQLRRGAGGPPRDPADAPRARSYLVLAWDYGLLALVFSTLAAQVLFGVLYSTLAVANLGLLLIASWRWYYELAHLS
jgi:phosphatidylglycerophosphate synthase